MATNRGREVSVSLRVTTLPVRHDGQFPLTCLNCRNTLNVHQPDAQMPDRMLATCDDCKAWHLVDADPSAGDILVVLLPGTTPFRTNDRG